jgi:hypothetical protein
MPLPVTVCLLAAGPPSDGSVIDWFGEKKHAYYAATKSAYGRIDVSLKYLSLFFVAGERVPDISAHIVADWAPSLGPNHYGAPDLNLTVPQSL